jgi:chitinase
MFVSYEDQRACAAKASYVRNRGLGGMIIWELGQDHRPNKPDPLLQAIKQAWQTPGILALQRTGQNVSVNFTGAPLGSYQVQWSTNLLVWNSLLLTDASLTWTGGIIQATDPNFAQPRRFYRVKTPP